MKGATTLVVLLLIASSFLASAYADNFTQPQPQSLNQAVRSRRGQNWFEEFFDEGKDEVLKNYFFSGYWGNGQPFNVGWDPSFFNVNEHNVLELLLKKQDFWHQNNYYPYTAGELKSRDFYSTGSYIAS